MSNNPTQHALTRRQALGHFAALLAVGLWPGAVRGDDQADGLTFVAANDFHHDNAACDPWFEGLFRQIGTHTGIAFCLGLGDLANKGLPESIEAIRRHAALTGVPFHPTPGNHDNDLEENTRVYTGVFPEGLNYSWEKAGWQFVSIDSSDGKKWGDTHVSEKTLAWLDAELPRLDRRKPTVLCTHFPLARSVKLCPLNAEDVLARFAAFNLRGVFSGHYHGQTHVSRGNCGLVTNVCCSRIMGNHDGTTEKGYWLCRGEKDGTLSRLFVRFSGAPKPASAT